MASAAMQARTICSFCAVRQSGAIFHMAAQVAVTTSLDDPRADFETNVLGAVNLLEAARGNAEPTPVIFASTNKVYGDLADLDQALPRHRADNPRIGSRSPNGLRANPVDGIARPWAPAVAMRGERTIKQAQS